MRGAMISFEGTEGAGKSTQLVAVRNWFLARGIDPIVTREPGGTAVGEDVRTVLLASRERPVDPMAELLLMFAARAQHVRELILPALRAGRVVLCDRFTDASFAYQGGGRELGSGPVAQLEALVLGGFRPDLTLLFELPLALARWRLAGRPLDRIEQEDDAFFDRVREAYLARAAAEPERFRVIDASGTPEQVEAQTLAALRGWWLSRSGDPA